MLLRLLTLSLALAEAPAVPDQGFRMDEQAGWRQEGAELVGPTGARISLWVEPAGQGRAELAVADIQAEQAALEAELAARKLKAVDLEGRIVTTPIGEPEVLLRYGLAKARGHKGEAPPPRGLRVTRRCGPTVRLTMEGEAPEQPVLLEGAAQLLWADPSCERWNVRPYHSLERAEATLPVAPKDALGAVPTPAPAPEEGGGEWVFAALAALALVGAGAGGALWWKRRESPPAPAKPAAPAPARPRPAKGEAGAPPPPPLLTPEPAPAPPPAAAPRPEPRPLGALGASEGVWVTPVASPRGVDPLAVAIQQLGQVVGLDRAPPPAPELPELPATWRAVLELHDGASFGGGWLRLLGAWDGRGLTIQELNRQIQGRVGRRVAVGFFANGTLVLLGARGELLVAAPGDHMPRRIAANPTSFLATLAEDVALREELCSLSDTRLASRQLGPLGPDQVLVTEGGDQQKRSVLAVWERAPSLL